MIHHVVLFSENGVFQSVCQGQRVDEAQARVLKYHQLSPIYENVFVADKSGKIFMDSIGGKSVGLELAKGPALRVNVEKAQQGHPWVREAAESPATDIPIVTRLQLPFSARAVTASRRAKIRQSMNIDQKESSGALIDSKEEM